MPHQSPAMSMVYARISDPEVLRDYKAVLGPGAVIAGPGSEAVRSGKLGKAVVDWLKTNFLKTELELGHWYSSGEYRLAGLTWLDDLRGTRTSAVKIGGG